MSARCPRCGGRPTPKLLAECSGEGATSAEPQMPYRDYLIWTAAHTAHALTQAIRVALDMQDEQYAIEHLEHALGVSRKLAEVGTTTDRVAPRPTFEEQR